MRLSQAIAAFEKTITHVWQKPDLYDAVVNGHVCFVYGRKGAGKSTLVKYIELQALSRTLLLQGRDKDFLGRILTSIPSDPMDPGIRQVMIRNIGLLLECLVCVSVVSTFLKPAPESLIGGFMVENGLDGPDVGKQTAALLAPLFVKITLRSAEFEEALNKILKKYPFDFFRSAVYHTLHEENISTIVCIDDIDDITFSFSFADRCFIESLLAFVVTTNVFLKKNSIQLTILLTCPTEIFSHSGLFGNDWVEAQAQCLTWRTSESLHQLVNRRIAVEYAVRERRSLDKIDRFSASQEHTWNRLFPKELWNPLGVKEQTFDFLVRHTTYTPRQILMLCEKASDRIAEKGFDPKSTIANDQMEMSVILHECVSDNCASIVNNVHNVYGKLYEGLQAVFDAFRSRANIWSRNSLIRYIVSRELVVTRHDVKAQYAGNDLIVVLQKIGILGLGRYQKMFVQGGSERGIGRHFKPRFSFIEDLPPDSRWEVAVFSPYFADAVDMEIVDKISIKPDESFRLGNLTLESLDSYEAK